MEYLHVSRNIRGDKTRAQTLDAAWDLICEQGADISMSKIAAAAGISRQAVHQHFGTRGGLLLALVRRADERLEIKEKFDAALAQSDPQKRFKHTLDAWLDFVPEIYPVANDLIRLRATDPEAAAAWEDRMSDLRAWLLTLMLSLKNDRALKEGWSPEAASAFFWAQSSVQLWGLLIKECGWSEQALRKRLHQTLTTTLVKA